MEKIKNLINPGHKKDDEVLYGSGQSDDPVHSGTVHDSSKVSGNPLTSNKTGDDTGPTTAFSGYGNAPVPRSNRAPEDREFYEGSKIGTTGTSSSRMPGGFDDTATTASVKSGVAGEPQSGSTIHDPLHTNKPLPGEPETAGSGITGASGVRPHSSSLANKADPRVDSDLDDSRGVTGGPTGTGSGLTGTGLPDRSVGSAGLGHDSTTGSSHLGRDAAVGAGVLGGSPGAHHHREKQEIGSGSGRVFPLGSSSTTSTSGHPSSSTGRTVGTGLGSTTGGHGSGTGPTASSANQGSVASNASLGAYNEESWTHDHSKHGHEFIGDPCGPEASVPGAPHFTKGPHALDTANRLDPRVSGGITEPTGSTNTGSSTIGGGLGSASASLGSSTTATGPGSSSTTGSGLGSSTTGTGFDSSNTGDHHLKRDAAIAGGAGAVGAGAYESSRGGPGSTTAGPHRSDLLNKADPRVDSDLSKSKGLSSTSSSGLGHGTSTTRPASGVKGSTAEGTALPSDTTTSGSTTGRDHHLGRDVGIGGAGAAGLAAHEAGKHHGGHGTTGATSGSTVDPYSSSGTDPRIDSTSRSETSGLPGTGTTGTTGIGKDHHLGRDAGLAGAGGLTAYEGEKHLGGKYDPTTTGTSSTGQGSSGDVFYDSGRGPTTSGATQSSAGTGLSSTTHGGPGQTTSGYDQQPTSSGHHLGRDAGLAGAGGIGAHEAEKHLGKDRSRDTYGTDPTTTSTDKSTGHHYGRDAALGVGGVGAGTAAYEAEKHRGTEQPPGTSPAYDNQQAAPSNTYTGRDAALAGGAGAGAGALAGSEFSKNEAERDAHQGLKDQKAHEKELAAEQKAHDKALAKDEKAHAKELEKEQKHHAKEVAAAEKKHEKEVEKAEKKHDKELAAAEKKHEKEAEKEEKHEEKKHHGGILGLFKRDKPDDELKRENLERKGELPVEGTETAAGFGAAGAGAAGLSEYERHERAGDHAGMSEADKLRQAREHDRNRLHKDPPPGYIEKKMEQEGGGHGGSTNSGYETLPDGRIIEPHTGLPVDLSKGSGAGGTDDTPVPGIHSHQR